MLSHNLTNVPWHFYDERELKNNWETNVAGRWSAKLVVWHTLLKQYDTSESCGTWKDQFLPMIQWLQRNTGFNYTQQSRYPDISPRR